MLANSGLKGDVGIDSRRAQILRQMGIDVWFERPTAVATDHNVAEAASVVRTPPRHAEPVPRAREPKPARMPEVQPTPSAPQVPEAPEERFALLCIRTSHALLFCEPLQVPAQKRLAHDIAQSVSLALGQKPGKVQVLEFQYPQVAGVPGGDWRRALRAFYTKQHSTTEPDLVLLAGSLAHRFEGWLEHPVIVLEALSDLVADGGRKRVLWKQICERLS